MEQIFPEYTFGSVSLPLWQNNIIRRFSEHRKYRVLLWEFGPTLFEHLCKQKGFDSKVLLQKNKDGEVSKNECLMLLEAFGEMKVYWWWPWSKKIKDVELTKEQWERAINYDSYSFLKRLVLSVFTNVIVHQWYIVKYGYVYNYQQLTEAQARREAGQSIEQSLVVQAASFMRVAESSSDKNKMIIYHAQVKILKDLLILYREINSRFLLHLLSEDRVYQAREEVYTIHEEMNELVKEIGKDIVLNSIKRAEDLVKKSGTIMLNLKKYRSREEDYRRLEQEVNNLIEQEAQRAEQEAQRAAKLEEMLRRMGVDPETALDDVNVSQGTSAGIGRGSGAGV